jgi:citrate/tricarballylate utilization protein
MFGLAFGWAVLALTVGAVRFWRGQSPGEVTGAAAGEAVRQALALTYLDGGHGDGCNEADDRFTLARRRFHHLTFYGFMLCFASTCVATLYHYVLGQPAPYALTSLPVVLGTVGGLGLLAGPAGLLWLNLRRHPLHGDPAQRPMDRAFIVLLFATSLTGLALLAWRDSGAMALLLAVHLGTVMALFLTLPYGKFAHAVYRAAALLKWAIERRQPSRLQLGAD